MRPEHRTYLALASVIVLIDQLSKIYINSYYILGESKRVLGDFIRFTFVFNPGGAFGINFGNFWFYAILSLAAIVVVIIYFMKTADEQKLAKVCLAAVIGGAVGNMIDRILYGKVIDFIDINIIDIVIPPFQIFSFEFPGFELFRWYTFNMADAAITLGLIGFIIQLIFQEKLGSEVSAIENNNIGNY